MGDVYDCGRRCVRERHRDLCKTRAPERVTGSFSVD